MTAPGEKNAHGVYAPHEVIELPHDKRGWKGCALAEIALVRTAEGWRASTSFQFMTGSCWGRGSPLTDRDPPFSTRGEAIRHAAESIRVSITAYEAREVPAVLRWLDGLEPAQGNLIALMESAA